MKPDVKDSIQLIMTLTLSLGLIACAGIPKVTVLESEYEGLKTENRRLARELSEAKEDYEKERQESLKQREYLRKVEHPMSLLEEKKRAEEENCGVEYYGSTYSEEQGRHFDLWTKRPGAR